MKIGDVVKFEVMDIKTPPDLGENSGFAIAFVPSEGHQWCRYYSGSKTWQSNVTLKTVEPTSWLRLINSNQ